MLFVDSFGVLVFFFYKFFYLFWGLVFVVFNVGRDVYFVYFVDDYLLESYIYQLFLFFYFQVVDIIVGYGGYEFEWVFSFFVYEQVDDWFDDVVVLQLCWKGFMFVFVGIVGVEYVVVSVFIQVVFVGFIQFDVVFVF